MLLLEQTLTAELTQNWETSQQLPRMKPILLLLVTIVVGFFSSAMLYIVQCVFIDEIDITKIN